jgi:putative ABC transport system permease protein
MQTLDIKWMGLALGYLLLLIPLCIAFWFKIKILSALWISILRMTVQLLFVGFYLQVVFKLNHWWLNLTWLLIMVIVADLSIISRCGLRIKYFILPLFMALLAGTVIPLFYFTAVIIRAPGLMDAAYFIPLAGMIMGNCLRADIIGINGFYNSVKDKEKLFLHELAQGASLSEAVRPHLRSAVEAALSPTLATMATIGLVSLPGMMTGIILGGTQPMTAIKYQIAIMIAIFTGTTVTVILAILLTRSRAFSRWGVLNRAVFKNS